MGRGRTKQDLKKCSPRTAKTKLQAKSTSTLLLQALELYCSQMSLQKLAGGCSAFRGYINTSLFPRRGPQYLQSSLKRFKAYLLQCRALLDRPQPGALPQTGTGSIMGPLRPPMLHHSAQGASQQGLCIPPPLPRRPLSSAAQAELPSKEGNGNQGFSSRLPSFTLYFTGHAAEQKHCAF